jgi:glycerol uptake facilitator-like aquaporin
MAELPRRLAAEFLGTLILLAAVVGSGIMAERLTNDVALALLCNTLATGAILFVLIAVFAPVSGAHLNPAVTLFVFLNRGIGAPIAAGYVAAQLAGAVLGVLLAHAMFDTAIIGWGITPRSGPGQWLSESIAVFGLILTIAGCRGRSSEIGAGAVALYITAAYWFTASTSFANPAVTLARTLTPSFAGILPADAPAFIVAQLAGAVAAWALTGALFPARS